MLPRSIFLAALALAAASDITVAQPVTAPAAATQAAPAWSAPGRYVATIVQVNAAARLVTTRDAGGVTSTFEAPAGMTTAQLAGFAPGDLVTVTFFEGVDVRRATVSTASAPTSVDPATGARTATVTIVSIDPGTRVITFIGPRGRYARVVPASVDASALRALSIGGRAELTYFEYVQSMTRTPAAAVSTAAVPIAPPQKTESVRDRLTLYGLYGLDNSFSGKMIQAANGRTTGGAPIVLGDTSYDHVYGRLAMLKVGVGYRMKPRTEALINFVYSRSSAAPDPVQIGTAGTSPQVALKVAFTPYQYWGFEVGQRFFFPKERFTPFAGWLVGLNRNQDIRGTFVGVPANVTPGLAAQDGKFFERSWAFSLGPTGGVLFPVGPIDIVAETQLRFLGGLSDVDWLVEEGLRDINSKSERWSIPILAGVRIKF